MAWQQKLEVAKEEAEGLRQQLRQSRETGTKLAADVAERDVQLRMLRDQADGLAQSDRHQLEELERRVEEQRAQFVLYEEQLEEVCVCVCVCVCLPA